MAASQPGFFSLQEFSDLGAPLVGGRVYTYAQGTTTHKTAYTNKAGTIAHTYTSDGIGGQYIALDERGELPAPLYLAPDSYDIALKTAAGATIWTRRADPINDQSDALRADLADASDDAKGADLVGYEGRTVRDRLQDQTWGNDSGASKDATTLNAALSSGSDAVHISGDWAIGATDVTIPAGVSLIGEPGTTITSAGGDVIITGSRTLKTHTLIENIKFDMGRTAAQVYGEGADNVTTKHCEFTGSTNNGLLMSVGPRNYKSVHDWFHDNDKAGLYVAGTEADAPFKIIIDHPVAHDNGEGGVVVSGVGEVTSPAQTANYANVIQITSPTCYSNGTGTANSGLEVFYVTNAQITSPICYDNAEHGISLQEVSGFNIAAPMCYDNAFGGICMQSGYDPYNPVESGTIMGGTLTGNDSGILLKEICSNIQIMGTDLQNNTSYAARLVDIGGSGLKSNDITFMGCSGVPSGGSTITNSNNSTNVTAHNGLNHFGTTVQVNAMVNEAVTSSLTISTVGANETYPEMITLAAGADTQRCGIAQASDARRLTLRAAAGATINIQHNQGDGVTYAGFLNTSAATVTIANGASVTYVGNGTNFVQMS